MTDKEINGCNCGEDCGDETCDCEHEDSNVITLDMEDGTQKDFLVLDIIEHEGKQYIALAEVDSMEYDIMSMAVIDENVELSVIEDDDEFNAIAAKFDEHFSRLDEESEEE
ncbi:MAG: DUF1292 domain-containing protein [Candidatus Syntrophosphaera sp.]|nr:DUF1292 domain-containing protein [Candidatus Syntrophosphaera sp.]